MQEDRFAKTEHGEHVYPIGFLELLIGNVLEFFVGPLKGGIVRQDINGAERSDGFSGDSFGYGMLANVPGQKDRYARAWFSNYGDWVDVYTPGEGLVNAFATGEYTYKEPPKRPATQVFDGRARWSGTSFAAPLAAGLIAAEMSQAGLTASDATRAVLARAQSQAIPGVGPALYPR